MKHLHCASDNCLNPLANACGGVYCTIHEAQFGAQCYIQNCDNLKVAGTQACQAHQEQWYNHVTCYCHQSILGIRQLLRRTEEENQPWLPGVAHQVQPHDEAAPEPRQVNPFTAPRFYCVETVCAPCGVVIAWAKFAKSESPTNILQFLESVYPTQDSCPDYIIIDKACLVLRTSIANGSWNIWKNTTRFIVDSYHYVNHRTTDYLCRKWCNPAPLNGSAPNLVIVDYNKQGQPYYKRAFNTQACEQLNAWLGGFEPILKRMLPCNFDWFLHTMLFLHTE